MLLYLSDDELDAIMNACRPLAVDQRNAFCRKSPTRYGGAPRWSGRPASRLS